MHIFQDLVINYYELDEEFGRFIAGKKLDNSVKRDLDALAQRKSCSVALLTLQVE